MATYSLSKNVQIFPVTQRNIWDPLGRLTTEYNLTSILNKLLDVDGFVFTANNFNGDKKAPLDIDSDSTVLDFNLNGYIIHLKDLDNLITRVLGETLPSNGTSIYAYIDLTKKPAADGDDVLDAYEKEHFKYLNGYDTISNDANDAVTDATEASDVYKGVTFVLAAPDSDTHPIQLKILEYKQVSDIINPKDENYNLEHLKNYNEYSASGWYIPKESQIKFQSNLKRTSISIDDGVI